MEAELWEQWCKGHGSLYMFRVTADLLASPLVQQKNKMPPSSNEGKTMTGACPVPSDGTVHRENVTKVIQNALHLKDGGDPWVYWCAGQDRPVIWKVVREYAKLSMSFLRSMSSRVNVVDRESMVNNRPKKRGRKKKQTTDASGKRLRVETVCSDDDTDKYTQDEINCKLQAITTDQPMSRGMKTAEPCKKPVYECDVNGEEVVQYASSKDVLEEQEMTRQSQKNKKNMNIFNNNKRKIQQRVTGRGSRVNNGSHSSAKIAMDLGLPTTSKGMVIDMSETMKRGKDKVVGYDVEVCDRKVVAYEDDNGTAILHDLGDYVKGLEKMETEQGAVAGEGDKPPNAPALVDVVEVVSKKPSGANDTMRAHSIQEIREKLDRKREKMEVVPPTKKVGFMNTLDDNHIRLGKGISYEADTMTPPNKEKPDDAPERRELPVTIGNLNASVCNKRGRMDSYFYVPDVNSSQLGASSNTNMYIPHHISDLVSLAVQHKEDRDDTPEASLFHPGSKLEFHAHVDTITEADYYFFLEAPTEGERHCCRGIECEGMRQEVEQGQQFVPKEYINAHTMLTRAKGGQTVSDNTRPNQCILCYLKSANSFALIKMGNGNHSINDYEVIAPFRFVVGRNSSLSTHDFLYPSTSGYNGLMGPIPVYSRYGMRLTTVERNGQRVKAYRPRGARTRMNQVGHFQTGSGRC